MCLQQRYLHLISKQIHCLWCLYLLLLTFLPHIEKIQIFVLLLLWLFLYQLLLRFCITKSKNIYFLFLCYFILFFLCLRCRLIFLHLWFNYACKKATCSILIKTTRQCRSLLLLLFELVSSYFFSGLVSIYLSPSAFRLVSALGVILRGD